jgi:TIR domain
VTGRYLDRAEAIAEQQVPAIFISHSSLDPEIADDIKSALDRFGFEQVFLDFDKATGIGAGENWEKRLYEELSRCHAVILMLTPNWLASKWCFAELTQSRALGKIILPIICKPLGERFVLPEIQSVDLLEWNAGGLDKLERRLRLITNELARGFKLDPNRPPYPGIHAFEAEDAASAKRILAPSRLRQTPDRSASVWHMAAMSQCPSIWRKARLRVPQACRPTSLRQ